MLSKLSEFFSSREYAAYVVGGYLRDFLLSLPGERDVDIAVAGDSQSIGRDLAGALGGTFVPLGLNHGVARVTVQGFEGRRLTIDLKGFSGDIEEDLARRDFTIDAMALPLEHWSCSLPGDRVVDPYNGRQDLARKRIRALSPRVFQDDPARLLRAVRLAARLRFGVEPETARLVRGEAFRISEVSGERLRDEFLAVLSLDGARGHLEVLDRLDLLCRIIPELALTKGVDQPREHYWDVWGHMIHAVETAELVTQGHQNSPIYTFVPWSAETEDYFGQDVSDGHTRRTLLKLGALFHDIAKPQTKKIDETGRTRFPDHSVLGAAMAASRLDQLKVSSGGIARVSKMVEQHLRPMHMMQGVEVPTRRAIYRYFRDLDDVAVDTLYLCLADYLAAKGPELSLDDWTTHARMVAHILHNNCPEPDFSAPGRLVSGHDLMEQFDLDPGPLIGTLLEKIQEARAAREISSRDGALALAAETLKSSPGQV